MTGRNCRFLQGRTPIPRPSRGFAAPSATRPTSRIDILNYRKDGSTFHNALYVGPVRDEDGKVVYFFASQLDASEHHRMQAEIDDLKSRLAEAEARLDRR